jgi:hypothetical protein
MSRGLLLLLLLGCALPASATTVFKCRAADGRVIYQDKPCAKTQQQQTLHLIDAEPAVAPAPAPSVATPQETAEQPPLPPPAAPTAPLPYLYACVRATDGKSYLSGNGDPAPYLAPFGMLGAVQLPLSQVYGPDHSAAGISAPESNRGRVSPELVGSNYVWVQDQCRELTVEETCHALRDEFEQNEHKLQHAFKSDRPPLEQRDRELRAQLDNCEH